MKTKIILAFTIILAIAVLGFARPSQSKEKKSEEKKKKESAEKKKNKWITKEGNTIFFISEDGSKKSIVLNEGDKKFFVKKDGKGNWTIKGDELTFHKGDNVKVIKLKNGSIFIPKNHFNKDHKSHSIDIDVDVDDDGKKSIYIVPRIKANIDLNGIFVFEEHGELNEKIEKLQKKLQKITEKEVSEALAEIETKTLKEIEEVLSEISEKLDHKSESLKNVYISVHPKSKIKVYEHLEDIHEHLEEIEEIHEHHGDKEEIKKLVKIKEHGKIKKIHNGEKVTVKIGKDDQKIQITFEMDSNKKNRNKYEKIISGLKNELKGEYQVSSKIDEEGNILTINISGTGKNMDHKKDLKNLVKEIIQKFKETKNLKLEKFEHKK